MEPVKISKGELLASLQYVGIPNYDVKNKALYQGRLTVIEQIYHQQSESDPTNLEEKYSRILESEDEPYKKKITVNQEWINLPTGDFKEASLVIIRNIEGKYSLVHPTQEQVELVKGRIVEVGFSVTSAHIVIYPTESARFCPTALDRVFIRSRSGSCKISILVVPK